MKVSDLIIEFLINKEIKHIFGYPGGMVTGLMDSLNERKDKIVNHTNYHEQAAAFCALGYSLASRKFGVSYATSGPGATNLITGICNAYFDSIPALFITGNVNIAESKGTLPIRQKGFQEMDIISGIKNYTKYAKYIDDKNSILYELQKAYSIAMEGRFGPVLLDIPMNIFKEKINIDSLIQYKEKQQNIKIDKLKNILDLIKNAKRPCIIAGMGVNPYKKDFLKLAKILNFPIILSMPNIDLVPTNNNLNYGFLGAYGNRSANFIIHKADLIISLGSRLDIRQIGAVRENFAPNAKLIRIDIDENEFSNIIKNDEITLNCDCKVFINNLMQKIDEKSLQIHNLKKWLEICNIIKNKLKNKDSSKETKIIKELSNYIPNDAIITTDVGQNQVWVAQSFKIKDNQRILTSSSFGAMGSALPLAIGAYFGLDSKNCQIFCISGDGGFQMNIQELEFIRREKIPIKIIIINNKSLGMIRHFQEIYFDKKYVSTTLDSGYSTPNFKKIAKAYDLEYFKITNKHKIKKEMFASKKATIIEVLFDFDTYVKPKLEFGRPNCDQSPPLSRKLYKYLLNL